MALSVSNPGTPSSIPGDIPDTKKLKKVDQDIEKIKQNIQKNVSEIGQAMGKLGEKTAKQICLLRLDMVADLLDKLDSRLAGQVDAIANALEKEDV